MAIAGKFRQSYFEFLPSSDKDLSSFTEKRKRAIRQRSLFIQNHPVIRYRGGEMVSLLQMGQRLGVEKRSLFLKTNPH
jgi:hypothetical protein